MASWGQEKVKSITNNAARKSKGGNSMVNKLIREGGLKRLRLLLAHYSVFIELGGEFTEG